MILFLTVGIGLSYNNTFSTLLQQIMCPFGYNDVVVGSCIGCYILFGLIGCIVMGIIADKTKKSEELTKILYSIGATTLICIELVNRRLRFILKNKSLLYFRVAHYQ